ncbi:MAG: putative sugar O-methyltransferase [Arenicellales bacterium]
MSHGKIAAGKHGHGVHLDPIRERSTRARASPAYRNYQLVLERVVGMRGLIASRLDGIFDPSDYWKEELENFDYMFDASPLIVDKLRRHCHHVTGIHAYQYRSNTDEAEVVFRKKLRALNELGHPELLVPEPAVMGGFGFRIDGELCNLDTLKFYEALIALEKGEVLREFRETADRKAVWEIGAGWGGFAYQFRKIAPNTTYFIMDFPELFLFSATYLMTAFPASRVWFYDGSTLDALWTTWQQYDFVFLPHTALEEFAPPRLDLTVNMVSFQEMTSDQVSAYAARAAAVNGTYLYSLNRARSRYNTQIDDVHDLLRQHYWVQAIDLLPVGYTTMDLSWRSGAAPTPGGYRHLLGWKRALG